MAKPTNKAAYLLAAKTPLSIRESPFPTLAPNEITIRTSALAMNPYDAACQDLGPAVFAQFLGPPPCLIGCDVAGTVVEIGSAVTRFRVGDRVAGLSTKGFQLYAPVPEHMAMKIPDTLKWEKAVLLPMGVSVAAMGLFGKEGLGMKMASVGGGGTASRGQAVLIWGGSTSMGANAIQLAAKSGYEVATTASAANFDMCKALGATHVFDYKSATVVDDLVSALQGKHIVGAFCNGGAIKGSFSAVIDGCAEVLCRVPGARKFLAMTMVPPKDLVLPDGVEHAFIKPMVHEPELAYGVFSEYLAGALAAGEYVPTPKEKVVGHGLEAIDGALQALRDGVSATKIVVTM